MQRLFILLFLLAFQYTSLSAQWKPYGHGQSNVTSGQFIFKVTVPSEDIVWATMFAPDRTPISKVLLSRDGLANIEAVTITTDDATLTAYDVAALDDQTAWVAMTSTSCQCYGQVYGTTDGGASWTKMLPENSQAVTGIHFWSANEGIALGSNGTGDPSDELFFLRTEDGGLTWTDVTPAAINPGEGLWLPSGGGHYEVLGDHLWIGSKVGNLWHSPDRGVTWSSTLLEANRMINTVAFKNELEGLAASSIGSSGFFTTNRLWETKDGGATWSPLPIPNSPKVAALEYVEGTPSTYAFTGGFEGRDVAVSTTDGKFWTISPADRLSTITYLSPDIAYAGGNINEDNKGGLYRLTSSFASDHINVKTLAGNGQEGDRLGQADQANLVNPDGITQDAEGQIYIANDYNNSILKLNSFGELELVAGMQSVFGDDVEGELLEARFRRPSGIAFNQDNNLIIADLNNSKVKLLDLQANPPVVSTLAGTGGIVNVDGPVDSASFNYVYSVAVTPSQDVIVSTGTNLRKISPEGIVTTLAGQNTNGDQDGQGMEAAFNFPWDIVADTSGNIYLTDIFNHKIKKVTPEGVVSTVAGSGISGSADGQGSQATFNFPEGIAVTPTGHLFVGEGSSGRIRQIDTAGVVSLLAGKPHNFYPNGFIGLPGPVIVNGDGAHAVFARSRELLYTPQNSLLHTSWGSDMLRELQIGIPSAPITFRPNVTRELATVTLEQVQPVVFSGEVENISEFPVGEVSMRVSVFRGNSRRYFETSPVTEMAVGAAEAITLAETFTPDRAANYRVEYEVFAEDVMVDYRVEYLEVSDSIMAKNDGQYYLFAGYGSFLTDFDDGYGVQYSLAAADTVTGLQLFGFIPGNTPVNVAVYETDGDQIGELITEHEIPFVTEDEAGAVGTITLPMPDVLLEAGDYVFTVQAAGIIPAFDNSRTNNNYLLRQSGWTNAEATFGSEDLLVMLGIILGEGDLMVSVIDSPFDLADAQVFPNPFVEELNISLGEVLPTQVMLYDANGRLMKRTFFQGLNHRLDGLEELPSGMYTLLLESRNGRRAFKLVKPR